MAEFKGGGMIRSETGPSAGVFLASDSLAILVSFFYSYLFRFYAYIVPVDPARGIPPLRSYVVVFPLFLAVHLAVFALQGFYKRSSGGRGSTISSSISSTAS